MGIVLGTSGPNLVVLNQNNNGRLYVTKDAISKCGLRGYLRPKSYRHRTERRVPLRGHAPLASSTTRSHV